MLAYITRLQQWKAEYTPATCQDKLLYDAAVGLFAVADGASTSSFPHLWAEVLVKHFISVPLMSADPFEVDWWVRLAQKRYTDAMPRRELLSSAAREKEESEGSASTLVTLRLSRVDKTSAQAELLAFGDSCVLIGRPATRQVALTFPLEQAADFDRRPVCVPSHPGVFSRQFHQCKLRSAVPLAAGDVVLLVTDAVARWIISKGGGQYQEQWESFQAVAQQTPGADWQAFILNQRQNNTMADDDSTALILALQADALAPPAEGQNSAGEVQMLGTTLQHRTEVIEERANSFRQARSEQNREMEAIYYGDGTDLHSKLSGEVTQKQIDDAREVSNALRALISASATHYKKPDFGSKMRAIWEQYKDVLKDEPCADDIRNTLRANGVFDPPAIAAPPLGKPAPAFSPEPRSSASPVSERALPAETMRQDAMRRFRAVLQGGSPNEIVNAHNALLSLGQAQITSEEQARVDLASQFLAAFFRRDEEALVAAHLRLQQLPHPECFLFTPEQAQQLADAIQHSAPLGVFQAALQNQRADEIATAYQRWQQAGLPTPLTPQEMTLVQLARRLTDALAWDTEEALAAAYQALLQAGQQDFFILTPEQRARLEQAHEEATHPMDPYTVLVTVNDERITAGYLKQVKSLKRYYLPLRIEEYERRRATHPPDEEETRLQMWIERWRAELSDWKRFEDATLEELIDDVVIKRAIEQAQIHRSDLKDVVVAHDIEKIYQAITTTLGRERYAQLCQDQGLRNGEDWSILASFVRRRKVGAYLTRKQPPEDLSTWVRKQAQILRPGEAAPPEKQKPGKRWGSKSS